MTNQFNGSVIFWHKQVTSDFRFLHSSIERPYISPSPRRPRSPSPTKRIPRSIATTIGSGWKSSQHLRPSMLPKLVQTRSAFEMQQGGQASEHIYTYTYTSRCVNSIAIFQASTTMTITTTIKQASKQARKQGINQSIK